MTGADRARWADSACLVTAVVCASSVGPLLASIAAPALAVVFWRTVLGVVPVVLFVAQRRLRVSPRPAAPRAYLGAAAAGVVFAVHITAFTASFAFVSVASAMALVSSQAAFAGLFRRAMGERFSLLAVIGIGVALVGVLVLTGVDFVVSPDTLPGSVLALGAGALGGLYWVLGARVRGSLGTAEYSCTSYAACAVTLLAAALAFGQPLTGFGTADWMRIVALALVAQVIGQSLFTVVLGRLGAVRVALSILFTVPLSTIMAAIAIGQAPPAATLPALVLLLAGLALFILGDNRSTGRPPEYVLRSIDVPAVPERRSSG